MIHPELPARQSPATVPVVPTKKPISLQNPHGYCRALMIPTLLQAPIQEEVGWDPELRLILLPAVGRHPEEFGLHDLLAVYLHVERP